MNTHRPFPFVVIEGLDGVGKSTIAKAMAGRLNAQLLRSPGELGQLSVSGLGPLRPHFDATAASVRREFYRFANTVVSAQVRASCQSQAVVLDRYWPSTVAYASALDRLDLNEGRLPGNYPSFLEIPDVVILVDAPSDERIRRRTARDGGTGTPEESRLETEAGIDIRVFEQLRAWSQLVLPNPPGELEETVAKACRAVAAYSGATM